MSAEGFRLRLAVARLQQRHNTVFEAFDAPPPLPAPVGDMIVEGYASCPNIDRQRTLFRADCWQAFTPASIPLLFRHERPAGKILALKATPQGLHLRALVTDREAARCQYLSIAASVLSFHGCAINHPDEWHVTVSTARLDEVSLVHDPVNIAAKITAHYPPPASNEFYDLMIRRVRLLMSTVDRIKTIARHPQTQQRQATDRDDAIPLENPPAPRRDRSAGRAILTPGVPRPTAFRELVEAMQQGIEA